MEPTVETKLANEPASPFLDPLQPNVKAKIVLTEDDKINFFKAFLADKSYTETIDLFGGKFSLKLSTITVQQNNDVLRQISLDQEKGIAKSEDAYFIKVTLYRFVQCLLEVNTVPFCPDITNEKNPIKDGDSYISLKAKTVEGWPLYKLGVALEAFKEFEQKVSELAKTSLSKDFWKATT